MIEVGQRWKGRQGQVVNVEFIKDSKRFGKYILFSLDEELFMPVPERTFKAFYKLEGEINE